ncbi:MAG: PDZ domain-containing protein [Planctomycetota bacterium]|nr:MAG: PDZ domain-containing protein [Planctomycetota bacterium]
MCNRRSVSSVWAAALVVAVAPGWGFAAALAAERVAGEMFDRAAETLRQHYYDKQFRTERLPQLIERFRPLALAARTRDEERAAVHALLAEIPATHMGVISKSAMDALMRDLRCSAAPTLGFELIEYDGKQFAHQVLEGGPAAQAGLLRGDRIVAIDGVPVGESPRLDWRTDDAYLPDPPVRGLLVGDGERVELLIERRPGALRTLTVAARPYSAWRAAKASARVYEQKGQKIAYIHFWYIHFTGVDKLLRDTLTNEFADCDALVLDLRGRGGNGAVIGSIVRLFDGDAAVWRKPVIALVNRLSRSAKEVIAYEFRKRGCATLVGEPTAGAVIPASFADIGEDTLLMFPAFKLKGYTDELEGVGVRPHISVCDAGPFSAGADPVLEAGLVRAVEEIRTRRAARSD